MCNIQCNSNPLNPLFNIYINAIDYSLTLRPTTLSQTTELRLLLVNDVSMGQNSQFYGVLFVMRYLTDKLPLLACTLHKQCMLEGELQILTQSTSFMCVYIIAYLMA